MSRIQSRASINRLLQQYPFLQEVVAEELKCAEGVETTTTIVVLRGDSSLLYRMPDPVSGNGMYLMDPEHNDLKGTSYEYYRAVSQSGQLGFRQEKNQHFVHSLFTSQFSAYPNSVWDHSIENVVWVNRECWFELHANNLDNKPVRTDISIVLFTAPVQGWDELVRTTDPLVNVRLHGHAYFPGAWYTDKIVTDVSDKLNALIDGFVDRVWHTGLSVIIDTCTERGMSGIYGDVKLLSYVIAGRVMLTFKRGDQQFSIVGAESESNPRFGVQSVDGTYQQLESMVQAVTQVWQASGLKTLKRLHTADTEISIG